MLRQQPLFNGRAAIMGFCYGGPYAILGPKRLGYDAGISCHGSQMLDFVKELDGVPEPVCMIWGDRDYLAPANVLSAYRTVSARAPNVEVHVLPGVQHGYMMRENRKAFDETMYDFSMERSLAILECLRGTSSKVKLKAHNNNQWTAEVCRSMRCIHRKNSLGNFRPCFKKH